MLIGTFAEAGVGGGGEELYIALAILSLQFLFYG